MASWSADFVIARGRIVVRKTGADLALDGRLVADALSWFAYFALVSARAAWMRTTRPPGPRVWFAPDRPRPWYIVWAAAAWSGARIARSPEEADAAFHFEDATWTAGAAPGSGRVLNGGCHDVSKTRVAAVFEAVFGYPLALDPARWAGAAVEKGEVNGRHDGAVVQCPTPRKAGRSYQRLVDTEADGQVCDLRTACVQGRPVVVFVKRRPVAIRFSIQSDSVVVRRPDEVFSAGELATISRFAEAMGLDWGGLDILRDRAAGRLYVVDVNKTDVGPAVALSWRDKVRATEALAAAFLALVESVAAPAARPERSAVAKPVEA